MTPRSSHPRPFALSGRAKAGLLLLVLYTCLLYTSRCV